MIFPSILWLREEKGAMMKLKLRLLGQTAKVFAELLATTTQHDNTSQ